mgnify:FL=1
MSAITLDLVHRLVLMRNQLEWGDCVLEVGDIEYAELQKMTYIGATHPFPVEQWLAENGITLDRTGYGHGISLYPCIP